MVPNSFALAGCEEQSTSIFRIEVGPCVCIGVSELRPGGLSLYHGSFLSEAPGLGKLVSQTLKAIFPFAFY